MLWQLVLFFCITALSASPVLIGIAGGTGSGKTTLARKIHEAFPDQSVLISQDLYYKDLTHLPPAERGKTNFDHPNAIDFAQLREQLLILKQGGRVDVPAYSFLTHSRLAQTTPVHAAPLIIVEGILLFAIPEVRDLFDMKIFVDTDDDIRLLRRIERDQAERGREFSGIKEQYLTTVKPMHDAFVTPSKQYADIIVPEGGHNAIALDLILSKLKSDLKEKGCVSR